MRAALLIFALLSSAMAQEHVSFPTSDGGMIYGDLYSGGDRGVVLVHGGRFKKESWEKQARVLSGAGFRVLAIDLRSYGKSTGPGQKDIYTAPLYLDVLAAMHYLRQHGAKPISIVGASMGGSAGGAAAIAAKPGEVDRIVFLASSPDGPAEKVQGRKLFIVAREDSNGAGPRLPEIREAYEKSTGKKELIVVDGSAHAQFLFETGEGDRVMREILRFLTAP